MTLQQKLLAYYEQNTEDFNHDIEELDSWNGFLGDKRYYPMEDFSDYYAGTDPLKIMRLAFFGYDDDDSMLDDNEPFNPNRDYFYLNGLGDLVSTDQQDYSDYLDERFVEEIIENGSDNLTLSPGAQEIIEDYEEENDEENKMENVEKVNDLDTDTQREHLLDEIDRTKVVDDLLSAAGIWSIRDVDRFLEDADIDDLRNLKDDLEIYDKKRRQIEERR